MPRRLTSGAAQSAVYASICGLTVDGASMDRAPLNAQYAAIIHERQGGQPAHVSLAEDDTAPAVR